KLDPGTYNVQASGGGLTSPITFNGVVIGTDNVKKDFVVAATPTPEIAVSGKAHDIADGDSTPTSTDGTNLGSVVQGQTGPSATFTIQNTGTATLTVETVSVPTGFTLTKSPAGSIAAGASDTFTVLLNSDTVGTASGQIS